MSLPRKLLLPLACFCWAGLTSCAVASIQPGAPSAPSSPALSNPAQVQNQEAMPELGVFADGDLNNSLDLGDLEDLGEAGMLGE
jgi:hypothetical protein